MAVWKKKVVDFPILVEFKMHGGIEKMVVGFPLLVRFKMHGGM